MPQRESCDVVVLGSGQGGKQLAWSLAKSGKKVAVVERRWVGGSCPAVACMPSKNELWSARVAHIIRHAAEFGTLVGDVKTHMRKVQRRKQEMVKREIAVHLRGGSCRTVRRLCLVRGDARGDALAGRDGAQETYPFGL